MSARDEANAGPGGDGASGSSRTLDDRSRSSIENQLRSMYDRVAEEPVPDRFLDLLNQLERNEGASGSGAT